MLDPVEHPVDIAAKSRELVVDAIDWDTLAQIASLDLTRGMADRGNTRLQLPAEHEGSDKREDNSADAADREGTPDESLDLEAVAQIATDHQDGAIAQQQRQNAADGRPAVADDAAILEPVKIGGRGRPAGEV